MHVTLVTVAIDLQQFNLHGFLNGKNINLFSVYACTIKGPRPLYKQSFHAVI